VRAIDPTAAFAQRRNNHPRSAERFQGHAGTNFVKTHGRDRHAVDFRLGHRNPFEDGERFLPDEIGERAAAEQSANLFVAPPVRVVVLGHGKLQPTDPLARFPRKLKMRFA
jgi:hypothetical protein